MFYVIDDGVEITTVDLHRISKCHRHRGVLHAVYSYVVRSDTNGRSYSLVRQWTKRKQVQAGVVYGQRRSLRDRLPGDVEAIAFSPRVHLGHDIVDARREQRWCRLHGHNPQTVTLLAVLGTQWVTGVGIAAEEIRQCAPLDDMRPVVGDRRELRRRGTQRRTGVYGKYFVVTGPRRGNVHVEAQRRSVREHVHRR